MSDVKDQFDRWIDEGVEQYVNAEPPLGMEARVLAALERPQRTWWRPWMIAVPLAAVLALVIGLAVQNKTGAPPHPVAGAGETEKSPPPQPGMASTSNLVTAPVPQQHGRPVSKRMIARDVRAGASTAAAAPRPEIFPAPSPASEQERLLARLAQNQAATQNVAAKLSQKNEEIVISGITIKPIEIPLLPGPPEGE